MKAQANVNLHNRFDIEVRDAITGELKQSAKAFNIVLDAMWTRLCGGSSYFVNIHFGTGTGTLAPTRTSLFTHLGTKAAADDTLVKAIPNSSWKRKIVLNPEEFVGSTISEVGIAYGATASNLVTHAMLEDSEGNPITITKTDTDVITIYATVFVTFATPSTDVHFISMPSNNTLVNYLVGGGSAPTGAFSVGDSALGSDVRMLGLATQARGSSATATWINDFANKKRTTGVIRFGTTVGNGNLQELIFPNVFRSKLPSSGIFSGQSYAAVPVGTGTGEVQTISLPSKNIHQSSLVVKLDDTPTEDYTKTFEKRQNFESYSVPTGFSANSGSVAISRNGEHAIVSRLNVSDTRVLDLVDGAWIVKSAPPVTAGGVVSSDVSSDGSIIAVGLTVSPYVEMFSWVDNAWMRFLNPETLPPAYARAISLSSDGTVLVVGHGTSPWITTYKLTDGVWVKRPNPTSLPGGTCNDCKLSDNGNVLAVATDASPYLVVYDWSGTAWVRRASPSALASYGQFCALSGDGNILYGATQTNGTGKTYSWNGSAWTTLPSLPDSLTCISASLSGDGSVLVIVHNNATYYIYFWTGTAWVRRVDSTVTFNGVTSKVSISSNGEIVLTSGTNPTIGFVNCSPITTQVTLSPAAGVAITADYTVDGVHKTDQYVIDVGFSIQFGEPV